MTNAPSLIDFALEAHEALPTRIRRYLNERGILDPIIDRFFLGYNGQWITVPIYDRDGKVAFFKLLRDPHSVMPGPKTMTTIGGSAELYGWEHLGRRPQRLVICEGELDRLVLESQGIAAVTSTAGAGTFRPVWAEAIGRAVPEVYVCFDRDEAGQKGAVRVGRMIPGALLIELPEEVGPGGDITDFFVRLGRSREQFFELLLKAQPAPKQQQSLPVRVQQGHAWPSSGNGVRELKELVRIEEIVSRYVSLHRRYGYAIGLCPFHEDRNPSFVVYPKTKSFHCFGCRAHGDVITFLMRAEKLSFLEALNALRKLAGLP